MRWILFLVAHTDAARQFVARAFGDNCSVRVTSGECVVNPLFMGRECGGECDHLTFVDSTPYCARNMQQCYRRDSYPHTVCNATCRHHFLEVEESLAPSTAVWMLHAALPFVYTAVLLAVYAVQTMNRYSNTLML